MTAKQQAVRDAVAAFRATNGHGPTIAELAEAVSLSPQRVAQILDRLEALGLVARQRVCGRAVERSVTSTESGGQT